MKRTMLTAVAGCALPLIAHSQAHASYTGLSVELHTTVIAGGALRDVYRVYVNFSDPDDHLVWVAGSELLGPLTIQSRNATDTDLGTNFFNPGAGICGLIAPTSPESSAYWGTYVTIGISDLTQVFGSSGLGSAVDQTTLTPGFPNFIVGNQLVNDNMAWFTVGPVEQGRAGFEGDDDFELRVQIMQLAVNSGEHVRGTVAIGTVPAGYEEYDNYAAQTFNSIPAPAALGVFALTAVTLRRRRC